VNGKWVQNLTRKDISLELASLRTVSMFSVELEKEASKSDPLKFYIKIIRSGDSLRHRFLNIYKILKLFPLMMIKSPFLDISTINKEL
jgi:hypothetical protein